MYVLETVKTILNRYRKHVVISLLLIVVLAYVDMQQLNKGISSIEEIEKNFLSYKVPKIKRCEFNCRKEVNSISSVRNSKETSNVEKAVNIRQISSNEIVINGKRLKLLGVVSVGTKPYALFSCNRKIYLVSQNSTICNSLRVSSVNGTCVMISINSKQYILKILYGK